MSLETLKAEIDNVGNQIRVLKGSCGDVAALVARLNELKKEYADNNGGIGVDGKPYQAPLSKAEKKKLEKEKKAAEQANKETKVRYCSCCGCLPNLCLFSYIVAVHLVLVPFRHQLLLLQKNLPKSLPRRRSRRKPTSLLRPMRLPNHRDLPSKSNPCKWSLIPIFPYPSVRLWP